ncbi:MAG: hypothetical protein K9K63_13420, partial [Desulfotignum sp.]|nr:hypothetical protein [Desulfotignum sp.]MCF8089036.1 hypothetical protein [Desulfotignum sp.]MCF8138300.1 hypothetical protein [Desulfotignum sp.]
HVLSTPPAFILSQDQTLQLNPLTTNSLRSCLRPASNFITDQFSKIKKKLIEDTQTVSRQDRRNMPENNIRVNRFFDIFHNIFSFRLFLCLSY